MYAGLQLTKAVMSVFKGGLLLCGNFRGTSFQNDYFTIFVQPTRRVEFGGNCSGVRLSRRRSPVTATSPSSRSARRERASGSSAASRGRERADSAVGPNTSTYEEGYSINGLIYSGAVDKVDFYTSNREMWDRGPDYPSNVHSHAAVAIADNAILSCGGSKHGLISKTRIWTDA